jgi:hypothetical protein
MQLLRFHRTQVVKAMMTRFPFLSTSAAHVRICELMFRGDHKSEILLACTASGLEEVKDWLGACLEPLADRASAKEGKR